MLEATTFTPEPSTAPAHSDEADESIAKEETGPQSPKKSPTRIWLSNLSREERVAELKYCYAFDTDCSDFLETILLEVVEEEERSTLVKLDKELARQARQREAAKAAAARAAAARRAEEAREPRGILCNDGTQSPSCYCGGPLRGCCSHHRGVAGCSE